MELFGSIKKTKYTFGKWYLSIPELWCKDSEFIKKHPYPGDLNKTWRSVSPLAFDFYKMGVEYMDFNKVFDLRTKEWKDKLMVFVEWYGIGWVSRGGMWKDTSPLEHIVYMGNYNTLASQGYRWVVMNHGPDKKGSFVELWLYVNNAENPKKYYDLTILDRKEFFKK
jgi:hypothetical protein